MSGTAPGPSPGGDPALTELPIFLPMILEILGALQIAASGPGTVYNAREGQTSVRVPSVEASVTIDGVLDEPVWAGAAVLTGFSQYQPVDARPSPDSTEVWIWYSRNALHLAVRAWEPHGAVRATLADRDKVGSDDNVEIHLDTYNERNRDRTVHTETLAGRDPAAAALGGLGQHAVMLVIQFGPGAETVAASNQPIPGPGVEAVIAKGQAAVACQRFAVTTYIGRADFEAIAHTQLMAAGGDLKVAIIFQGTLIDRHGHQFGFSVGIKIDPGLVRIGLGHPQGAAAKAG